MSYDLILNAEDVFIKNFSKILQKLTAILYVHSIEDASSATILKMFVDMTMYLQSCQFN